MRGGPMPSDSTASAPRLLLTRRQPTPDAARAKDDQVPEAEGVYCVCRQPWGGGAMVCCDRCESWFHPACIGMPLSVYHDLVVARDHAWFCHGCTEVEAVDEGRRRRRQQQHGGKELDEERDEQQCAARAVDAGSAPTMGSPVCTCEREFQGELVLRCTRCQRAYHPDCVGLRQWEDWSDWRCSSCPRYRTRRTSGTSPSGSDGDLNTGPHAYRQQDSPGCSSSPTTERSTVALAISSDARGAVAEDTGVRSALVSAATAPCTCRVDQPVTMAYEEPAEGSGATVVRSWLGRIAAIETSTGLLTICFDDGTVETNVSPHDPDLNLQPSLDQHEELWVANSDITDITTNTDTVTNTRTDGLRPSKSVPLVLRNGKGERKNKQKQRTAHSANHTAKISAGTQIRLRLSSPPSELTESIPGSPEHKRQSRLVVRQSTAAGRNAAVTSSPPSRLRLKVGPSGRSVGQAPAATERVGTASRVNVRLTSSSLPMTKSCPAVKPTPQPRRRFRWKIGKRQQRRPLTFTVPARRHGSRRKSRARPEHLTASSGVPLSANRATAAAALYRQSQQGTTTRGGTGASRHSVANRRKRGAKPQAALATAVVETEKKEVASVTHYCPVCLCDAEDPIMTPCSHFFCRECLARAAKECGRRCPMCRRSLLGFARALLPEAGAWPRIVV